MYPPEQFERVQKYGLPMMVTCDDALKSYITNVMMQLEGRFFFFFGFLSVFCCCCCCCCCCWASHCLLFLFQFGVLHVLICPAEWLLGNTVQKLIVVLASTVTGDVKERWQFDIECDKAYTENRYIIIIVHIVITSSRSAPKSKSEKEIHTEIQFIIRQITASVTFLPLLEEPCE